MTIGKDAAMTVFDGSGKSLVLTAEDVTVEFDEAPDTDAAILWPEQRVDLSLTLINFEAARDLMADAVTKGPPLSFEPIAWTWKVHTLSLIHI